MEPASSAELMLRTYEAFLLGLSFLLAAFAGVAFLTYLAFLCEECLSLPHSIRAHSFTPHSTPVPHHPS